MKAVVFHGIGDIRLDTVPEPELKRAARSTACGPNTRAPGWTKVKLEP